MHYKIINTYRLWPSTESDRLVKNWLGWYLKDSQGTTKNQAFFIISCKHHCVGYFIIRFHVRSSCDSFAYILIHQMHYVLFCFVICTYSVFWLWHHVHLAAFLTELVLSSGLGLQINNGQAPVTLSVFARTRPVFGRSNWNSRNSCDNEPRLQSKPF